jgi:hypothetical protein
MQLTENGREIVAALRDLDREPPSIGETRIERLRWAVENRRSVLVDGYLVSVWEAHHLVAYYDAIPEWNQYLFEGDPLPDVLALAIRYGESQDVA